MDLTDAQWAAIAPLVEPPPQHSRPGRPWQDTRSVVNGIFWVLRTGAAWADLPSRYPSHQTCHRRFRGWLKDGTLSQLLRLLAEDAQRRATAPEGLSDWPARRRSWRWYTSALLQSPIAVEALREDRGVGDHMQRAEPMGRAWPR